MAKIEFSLRKVKSVFDGVDTAYVINTDKPGLAPIKCREFLKYSHAIIAMGILIEMIEPLEDYRSLDYNEFFFNVKATFKLLGIKEL